MGILEALFHFFLMLVMYSIVPGICFHVIYEGVRFDQKLTDLFKLPNSESYFNDSKMIELRQKFEFELSEHIKHVYFYYSFIILSFLILLFGAKELYETYPNSINAFAVFLALFSFIYGGWSLGRLGGLKALVDATKPITEYQRSKLERIISESNFSDKLVDMINSNPKNVLAYIDVLNIEYQSKKLEEKRKYEVISSIKK